jgi:hypothetical protein
VLKKDIAVTERKLLARNDRIEHLELLVNAAEAKLAQRDQRFEEQMRHMRQQVERGEFLDLCTSPIPSRQTMRIRKRGS